MRLLDALSSHCEPKKQLQSQADRLQLEAKRLHHDASVSKEANLVDPAEGQKSVYSTGIWGTFCHFSPGKTAKHRVH